MKSSQLAIVCLIVLSASNISLAQTSIDQQNTLKAFLERFKVNQTQTMNEAPVHFKIKSSKRSKKTLTQQELTNRLKLKIATRNKIVARGSKNLNADGRAAYLANDRAENLIELQGNQIIRNLVTMNNNNLLSAKLPETPWSDDYWPLTHGVLGRRFADRGFESESSYPKRKAYVLSPGNSLADILRTGDANKINSLSPSEKYDLLIGAKNLPLTSQNWRQGNQYSDRPETEWAWMGICHGWAPAAYSSPRARQLVTVPIKLPNGQDFQLKLYPSDLKSLTSLIWSVVEVDTKFIGGRCDLKANELKKDPVSGRILDQECFDNNPRNWHMAVVNQIGIAKKSFVMDSTFDAEVWNQPVYSYSYTYFNPKTKTPARTLKEATVRVPVGKKSFDGDKFLEFRSPKTKLITGISMTMQYVAETSPSQAETDSPANDDLTSVTYQYDLELDDQGNIIGGEWYSNAHPDFLWTPKNNSTLASKLPLTGMDNIPGNWDGTSALPLAWTQAAQRGAASGFPMSKIIDALLIRAQSIK